MNPYLPCNKIPLYKNMARLDVNFKAYQETNDPNMKDTIIQILDRSIENYEEAISFVNAPLGNASFSPEIADTYLMMRTLDSWHDNLPNIIANAESLQLDLHSETLKKMQHDKRYTPTFKGI